VVKKKALELGVVVQSCNLSTLRPRQEDREFKASLGYPARPHYKQTDNKNKE
jgi:hypothetical protein